MKVQNHWLLRLQQLHQINSCDVSNFVDYSARCTHHKLMDRRRSGLGLVHLQEYLVPPDRYAFSYSLKPALSGEQGSTSAAEDAQRLWRLSLSGERN